MAVATKRKIEDASGAVPAATQPNEAWSDRYLAAVARYKVLEPYSPEALAAVAAGLTDWADGLPYRSCKSSGRPVLANRWGLGAERSVIRGLRSFLVSKGCESLAARIGSEMADLLETARELDCACRATPHDAMAENRLVGTAQLQVQTFAHFLRGIDLGRKATAPKIDCNAIVIGRLPGPAVGPSEPAGRGGDVFRRVIPIISYGEVPDQRRCHPRTRIPKAGKESSVKAQNEPDNVPAAQCLLTDEVLLQICRVSGDDEQVTPEWMNDLQLVPRLIGRGRSWHNSPLAEALTLLASLLGKLRQFNPMHLPFGYEGPRIQPPAWVEREALESIGKQIAGLVWHDMAPATVAMAVGKTVSEAVSHGFLQEQQYDDWRPGMRSGSGWTSKLSATPYGMAKVRALMGTAADQPVDAAIPHSRHVRHGSMGQPGAAGWQFDEQEDGKIRASNTALCLEYAEMGEQDLLALSGRWRQMAIQFTATTKDTGHYHGVVVHDPEVQRVTKLLETAVSERGIEGVDRLGRCLRRPDTCHLHWALAALDELDAKLRVESSNRTTLAVDGDGQAEGPAVAPQSGATRGRDAASCSPANTEAPLVELRGKGQPCRVLGKEKRALSDAQYDVVEALLQSGDEGLKKDSLERVRTGARAALKRLADSDSDWQAVICFPARPGLGYRLCRPR
jgi:hypothetical protein